MSVEVQAFKDSAIPTDVQQAAHRQWASRPADQRFKELADLRLAVEHRRKISAVEDVDVRTLSFLPIGEGDDQSLVAQSPVLGAMNPTHWAFGQLASLVKAPADYLRRLPSDLTVKCLNYGLSRRGSEGVKLFAADGVGAAGDECELRAVTSQSYGRIWDIDVVEASQTIVDASNGKWFSPWAWSKTHRALFASDRDVFLFFVDGGSIVDGGGERDQLNRGFFVWNSEVGSATFGIACFLFRQVCGNYQIWGMKNVRVLKIRHTSGGPAKFVSEAVPALQAYAEDSALPFEKQIKAAKAFLLPKKEDDLFDFAQKQGFTRVEVKRAKQFAEAEEGAFATLWDFHNGLTAAARMLAHADATVELTTKAGKLMDLVTA